MADGRASDPEPPSEEYSDPISGSFRTSRPDRSGGSWPSESQSRLPSCTINERTDEIRRASEGKTACVRGEADGHLAVLLDPANLDACKGDVDAFEARLRKAVAVIGASPI